MLMLMEQVEKKKGERASDFPFIMFFMEESMENGERVV